MLCFELCYYRDRGNRLKRCNSSGTITELASKGNPDVTKLWIILLLLPAITAGCVDTTQPGASVDSYSIINPDDPASIAKWESSSYNFADAKIHVQKLSYLHGALGDTNSKDAASVAIQVYGAKSTGISPEQALAIAGLLKNEKAVHQALCDAIYDYYKRNYPAWKMGLSMGAAMFGGADEISEILPKVKNGSELDALITFGTIYVHPVKDGACCIGFDLLIPCDEEHGIGLRIQGDKVLAIGTAHEAFPVPDR